MKSLARTLASKIAAAIAVICLFAAPVRDAYSQTYTGGDREANRSILRKALARCENRERSGEKGIPKLVRLGSGAVWIVDYGDLGCTDHCGSGGCLLAIYSRSGHSLLFEGGARAWHVDRRKRLVMDVHGSFCGRAGVESCRRTHELAQEGLIEVTNTFDRAVRDQDALLAIRSKDLPERCHSCGVDDTCSSKCLDRAFAIGFVCHSERLAIELTNISPADKDGVLRHLNAHPLIIIVQGDEERTTRASYISAVHVPGRNRYRIRIHGDGFNSHAFWPATGSFSLRIAQWTYPIDLGNVGDAHLADAIAGCIGLRLPENVKFLECKFPSGRLIHGVVVFEQTRKLRMWYGDGGGEEWKYNTLADGTVETLDNGRGRTIALTGGYSVIRFRDEGEDIRGSCISARHPTIPLRWIEPSLRQPWE